ncbi:MAG: GNAT family N-acetyltransferase [Paludibacteraceae bacterium]|nr:GNAT family N-acetyltransferase [Paludibacteraceae bacterium]
MQTTQINIRPLEIYETSFLNEMLYHAVFVPEGEPALPRSIVHEPFIAAYTQNWGQSDTDIALLALANDMPVGAIWVRNFTEANKAYGFVSEDIPEMAMALLPLYRNRGIGRRLLHEMINTLRGRNVRALSLSVDKANYAYVFYQKSGFELVSEDETSVVMLKIL